MYNSDTSSDADEQARLNAFESAAFLALAIELGHDPRKSRDTTERHILVGLRFLANLRARGISVVSTHGGLLVSSGGEWLAPCKEWLAVQIERACVSLCIHSNHGLIKETRAWLLRQPELWHDNVPQNGAKPAEAQP